jgi:hypothetical protein
MALGALSAGRLGGEVLVSVVDGNDGNDWSAIGGGAVANGRRLGSPRLGGRQRVGRHCEDFAAREPKWAHNARSGGASSLTLVR